MASTYVGIDIGKTDVSNVSVGTSTTSKPIELVIDKTNSPTREQVTLAINTLKNYLATSTWPAA